jgi:hypothetical protein
MSQFALIAVECCSSWPTWAISSSFTPVVVKQRDHESPKQFAERSLLAAAALETTPRLAVVVCNERTDEGAEAARRSLISTLLARSGDKGSILLVASDRSSGAARRALADLARACNDRFDHARVSVRFGDIPSSAGELVAA